MSFAELKKKFDEVDARNRRLAQENQILREEIAILKKGLFGRKSERLDHNQLALFEEAANEVIPEEPETTEIPAHTRRKKGHGRALFPDHLPRNEIRCDVPEDQRCCPVCDKDLVLIDSVDICERGHIIPARIEVNRFIQLKRACPDGHCIRTGKAPSGLIDRCKYEPSVYAHVAVSKYCDHVPLHRMEGIFKRHGFHLPKQTMWDMLVRIYELVAAPVLRQMKIELLRSTIIYGDETPVITRVDDERGTRKGYVWCYRDPDDRVVMDFTLSRARDGPTNFFKDWSGTAIFDGYSGFNEVVELNGIIRGGCWAHSRRKFNAAFETGSKASIPVLILLRRLFWIERAVKKRAADRGMSFEELAVLRFNVRRRLSRRLLKRIFDLADDLAIKHSTLPKSQLGKAVKYLLNQREPLSRCLADGRIEIHNNDTERTLRHLAVGRKNWLVFGSPRGGHVAAHLYSLMLSCKAMGIAPDRYLEDILMRVDTTTDIAELTPWAWAAANGQPLTLPGAPDADV